MTEYKQLKISVDPSLAAAFKTVCRKSGTSMAHELSTFMRSKIDSGATLCDLSDTETGMVLVSTRAHRRKATASVVSQIECILIAEESYRDRIPENLKGSDAYEVADQAVDSLEQAIALLTEAF
jgi:hypothetical protein